CVRTGLGGINTHNFLLLCIPFMHRVAKLYQPDICRINSDQEFLYLLRRYYNEKRGRSPWRLLRKVKAINFVKVDTYLIIIIILGRIPCNNPSLTSASSK